MKLYFHFLFAVCLLSSSFATTAKQSLSVTFTHEGLILNGRLQLPDGNGPFQVIIINPGTGANDRDGTLQMVGANVACLYPGLNNQTLTPYKGLSEALSDSGYAVFTYDKVEYTYPSVAGVTFSKLWLPVASAIKFLKTRNDIDTSNIVILGHSEGSTLAPYIARTEPSVVALISVGGPRKPLDSLIAYQVLNITYTCSPQDSNAAKTQASQILTYFADVRAGNTTGLPPFSGLSASVWADYIKVADSVAINYNLAGRRTLFVGLGDDINVPVATEFPRFQAEVSINSAYPDFYTVPGVNHYLTNASDPATSEVLTDTIVYWLRKNVWPVSVKTASVKHEDFRFLLQDEKLVIDATDDRIEAIAVYDASGKKLISHSPGATRFELDIASYIPGLYFVHASGRKRSQLYKLSKM
jgi:hypothetical protein